MSRYLVRRVLRAIPTLLLISFVLFAILSLAPGDPLSQFAANPAVPPEVRDNIRRSLGLDDRGPYATSSGCSHWPTVSGVSRSVAAWRSGTYSNSAFRARSPWSVLRTWSA